MPTSHPMLITPVATQILQLQPKSVLDIGVGFGKWGSLSREYTDVWNQREVKDYETRIDGIEIFPNYRNPNWINYDEIHMGDAQQILPTLESYDLILFLAVLEHIEKAEALEFLDVCRSKCKTLIFSYTNTAQGAAFGNANETHLSTWAPEDFSFPIELLAQRKQSFVYKTGGVS